MSEISAAQVKQGIFWTLVVVAFFYLLGLFQPVLTPFLSGIIIAYLLNPLVNRVERFDLPRWGAALLVLAAFFALLTVALALGIPLLVREVGLLVDGLPEFFDALQIWASGILEKLTPFIGPFDPESLFAGVKDQATSLLGVGRHLLGSLLAGGGAVVSFALTLLLVPIVAFYMMVDWPKFTQQIDGLLPRAHAPTIRNLLKEIDTTIAGFIRGQLSVCLVLGLFYGLGLALLGLDLGFVLGIAAGALTIIPYVGSALGLVAGMAMAWFQTGDMWVVGMAFTIFAIGQFVEGNILTPKLVGENVGLHPIWIIFALMAGGSLLGFVGLLVAVPVAAIIGVLVRHFIGEYKKSSYYSD